MQQVYNNIMTELNQDLNLSCKLQLMLAPRLLTMLKILNLPFFEMVEQVEKAASENPLLEIKKPEVIFEYVKFMDSDKKIKKETDFSQYDGLRNIAAPTRDIKAHLIDQLNLTGLSGNEYSIAEELIENIDKNGYLKEFDKVANSLTEQFSVNRIKIEDILKVIQTFEPDGVGARDLSECLLIQLEEYGLDDPEIEDLLKQVIENNLEELGRGEYGKIAEQRGVSEADIIEIRDFIKNNLNPYPAGNFAGEQRTIMPSYAVELKEDKIIVTNLEKQYGPKLAISSRYEQMLKDPKTDQKTMKFLKEHLDKAKEMIEDIEKREETGDRIMKLVVERQEDFFKSGAGNFSPLQQNEIADILGLHPSTISRAVAEKFVQTRKGIFHLKHFCPRELSGLTAAGIKSRIKDLIDAEDKNNPLTDPQIGEALSRQGIKISKRTIVTYRNDLEIDSYKQRRINGGKGN